MWKIIVVCHELLVYATNYNLYKKPKNDITWVVRMKVKILILTVLLLISVTSLLATHNRAGEITYEQIDDLTIRATITTFTRTSSFAADRDSLEMFWGDGTSELVSRTNGNGEPLPNDVQRNIYTATHTYPTRSQFTLSVTDPNRVAGIQNIDFPNSVNIQFYVETTLTLLDRRFQGNNSSAILLQPPIDFACTNQRFIHNPNAFDPDGDSLAYELITPFQSEGMEVPNYNLPDEIAPSDSNRVSLDPITGDFVWDSPPVQGDFNITILIKEFRNGILINEIIRDMQILVTACFDENQIENTVPEIETIEELCVIAGELIEFEVVGTDVDSTQGITLEALGAPLLLDFMDASFNAGVNPSTSPNTGIFRWQTSCDDIAETFYQIVFRVTDDFLGFNGGVSTLKTVRIKVLGPSPEDVQTEKLSSASNLISWSADYACDDTELFQGFSVWRRNSSINITIDSCQGGLEGQGYQQIIFLTNDNINGRYQAIDDDLNQSDIYCYRVVAEFAQLTGSNNLFNQTASLPSEESCLLFNRDRPFMTRASVENTDNALGSILTQWVLPFPDEIDTAVVNSPFSIGLQRGTGFSPAGLDGIAASITTDTRFSGLADDTLFLDQPINTVDDPYTYRVRFENATGFSSESATASSLFLSQQSGDQNLMLSWQSDVPWRNDFYFVYEVIDGALILIDSVADLSIVIDGLMNGEESCYVVESVGSYGVDDLPSPIRNFSQQVCGIPRDNEAPCLPEVEISTACQESVIVGDQFVNEVRWAFEQSDICTAAADLNETIILFSETEDGPLSEIGRVDASLGSFDHILMDNISGCYAIQVNDQGGNVSEVSPVICVDNCPSYELPNTFTPNGDNSNDLFTPTVNRFIDRIELTVYNRWGQVVFRTDNPSIDWDGTNFGGNTLEEGTYYYTCVVFESRVTGVVELEDVLTGFIQIII